MPVTARGSKSKLAICYETTFGQTPGTPAGKILPINSSQLAIKQELIESNTITGRRDPVRPVRGNIDVSGSIVVPVDDTAIGYWLKAMFGAPTTTGTTTKTHTFTVGDTQPSLVIEQQYPDATVYETFNGCKVSKFTMSMAMNNSQVTATLDIMGAKRTIGSSPFDAAATAVTGTQFSGFHGSIEEGGSPIATVVSADLNIDFGLDGDLYAIGNNGVRADILEGLVQVTGTLKAFFANNTLLNKAVNDTKSSLKLKFTNGTNSLEFHLEEVVYEQTSPGIEGSKGVFIELPYRAFYQSGTNNSVVKVTLVNSQASY